MAKTAQKSGNKSVAAGEDPFVRAGAEIEDDDILELDGAPAEAELDEEEEEAEELDELDEEEEEEEEEEEDEPAPAPKAKKVTKVVPPAKKAAKPVEAKPVAPPKGKPKVKEATEDSARRRLAPETRVVLTEVGRSLNGKGCHDAIAGILRARKSGSITVAELLTKLPAAFVPRTAEGTEGFFRAYISAAIRRGYITVQA